MALARSSPERSSEFRHRASAVANVVSSMLSWVALRVMNTRRAVDLRYSKQPVRRRKTSAPLKIFSGSQAQSLRVLHGGTSCCRHACQGCLPFALRGCPEWCFYSLCPWVILKLQGEVPPYLYGLVSQRSHRFRRIHSTFLQCSDRCQHHPSRLRRQYLALVPGEG